MGLQIFQSQAEAKLRHSSSISHGPKERFMARKLDIKDLGQIFIQMQDN